MYILIALIGFVILGLVSIMDKFILTKRVSAPAVYTFEVSIFSLLLLFLTPFVSNWNIEPLAWSLIFLDGFFFFLGLLFMFKGVKESEVSHVGPLIGAMVPFFTFFLSRFFLNEILTGRQIMAVVLLIIGSLIISFEKSKKHNGIHKGMLWGALSGLFFAGSHVASKYLYGVLGFVEGTILIRVCIGLCGAALLLWPSVRHQIFKKRNEEQARRDKKSLLLVIISIVFGVSATLITQYAISIGSVSVVNSLEGVRYGVLVVLVFLLSKFNPKLFREEYSRLEIVQEIIAILIICAGLGMLI